MVPHFLPASSSALRPTTLSHLSPNTDRAWSVSFPISLSRARKLVSEWSSGRRKTVWREATWYWEYGVSVQIPIVPLCYRPRFLEQLATVKKIFTSVTIP